MYPNLFSPIRINGLEVKNRIAYPALGLLYSLDGKLNDKYYDFFREKAAGGAGIVTVGPVGFDFTGSGLVAMQIGSDDAIPSFEKMVSIIKGEGARAFIQIFHAGAYSYSKAMGGDDPVAPSAVYSRYSKLIPRELSVDDIRHIQKEFVAAARRAKKAGFDGVEIIGSAGYLITQFLSPLKNLRTDQYGGSFENRVRFPREIIAMLREALGADYPLSIRMAGNDFVPGSNTSGEMPQIARVYEEAGIDLINVTGGWHESRVPQLPMVVPRGVFSYLAMNIKRAVSIPVMASNRITMPDDAERIISDGVADMVNLGRVLIADPHWPRKAQEGRPMEIRPCVACNQGCTDSLFSGQPVYCLVNARAGFEGVRNIPMAAKPKKVLIVGAGPGGCEAAIRAAEAGHEVELYEKEDVIGGQLWIAGAPPHKQELWELISYYDEMLDRFQNIDLHLETAITIDGIAARKPDHVIVAEGAQPAVPPIDGMKDPGVYSAWDLLRDDPATGRRVAVIGGGAVGLETAMFLAEKGTLSAEALQFLFVYEGESPDRLRELATRGVKEVTVFEMLERAGAGVGRSTRWILMGDVERYGVKVIAGARVKSVRGATVVFEQGGREQSLEFDTVVNAVGSRANRVIADAMEKTGIPYTVIGDGVKPAQIDKAVLDGYMAVMDLK